MTAKPPYRATGPSDGTGPYRMDDGGSSDSGGVVTEDKCTCWSAGPWGWCQECGTGTVLAHACPGGCDDVTCENVYLCRHCMGGPPCPFHGQASEWLDDPEDDE